MSSQNEAYFDSLDANDGAWRWLAARGVWVDPDEIEPALWKSLMAIYAASAEAAADADAWAEAEAEDAEDRLNDLVRDRT